MSTTITFPNTAQLDAAFSANMVFTYLGAYGTAGTAISSATPTPITSIENYENYSIFLFVPGYSNDVYRAAMGIGNSSTYSASTFRIYSGPMLCYRPQTGDYRNYMYPADTYGYSLSTDSYGRFSYFTYAYVYGITPIN